MGKKGGQICKLIVASSLLVIVACSEGENTKKQAKVSENSYTYRPGYLIIKHKSGPRARYFNELNKKLGTQVVNRYDHIRGVQVVEIPAGSDMKAILKAYRQDPNIAYAEPDYLLHVLEDPVDENPVPPAPEEPVGEPQTPKDPTADPDFSQQWFLNNTGQTGGTSDVDVNALEAWAHAKGGKEVVLAIIDTGIDYKHPDLMNNVWVNPGEIPGNNLDDDNNGYVDDIHGINAITKSGDPMDDNMHGTHVAGIIGAEGKNGVGISGVMQKASLLGCKFLDKGGSGSTTEAIACVNYLVALKTREQNPVNIVASNNSWGGGPYQQVLVDAIDNLKNAGVLFVAAASNDASDNDVTSTYPANYPVANIISVAATDHKDELASFSNYGRYSVHVSAPGKNIYSTLPNDRYGNLSGTSMATPVVTGIIGLLKSFKPDLNMVQLRNLAIASGQPVAGLKGKTISGRRVRVFDETSGTGALSCSNQTVQSRLLPHNTNLTVKVGSLVPLSMININCAETAGSGDMHLNTQDGSLLLRDDGKGRDSLADDGVFSGELAAMKVGNFAVNFPGEDVVNITAYDPSIFKHYKGLEQESHYIEFVGEALQASDDSVHVVKSPFPIKFANEEGALTQLYVSSNGTVSLTDAGLKEFQNRALPVSSYETIIAPLWDDLVSGPGKGDVFHAVLGEAPHRQLVVEWRDVTHYDANEKVTFQVVFSEDNSNIVFNYKDVTLAKPEADKGASATVGIQVRSDAGTTIGFNKAVLKDGMSLFFRLATPAEVEEITRPIEEPKPPVPPAPPTEIPVPVPPVDVPVPPAPPPGEPVPPAEPTPPAEPVSPPQETPPQEPIVPSMV